MLTESKYSGKDSFLEKVGYDFSVFPRNQRVSDIAILHDGKARKTLRHLQEVPDCNPER
jgi:hypothetical protein